ncbi:MAG: homoserine dehydrogenase [Alphaproteobacteria bacterium]
MNKKIVIAGLGTVGISVINGLVNNHKLIKSRTNADYEIIGVSARSNKDRGIDLSNYQFYDNPVDMAQTADYDILVEVMGGTSDLILDTVKGALKKGKTVITANKAMLASFGEELSQLAEDNNSNILFEASIAGGIPIVKTLREGMIGNKIEAIYGILNGTCNYILTTVKETGRSFEDVLKEAQELGYAEAEPSFDVDGYDAGQKLALMSAIGFGIKIPYDKMYFEGIMGFISGDDIEISDGLGLAPRLIGTAKPMNDGYIVYMAPCLVSKYKTMGNINGVTNACVVVGDMVGSIENIGAGAGGGATASAVIADISDALKGNYTQTFNGITKDLKSVNILPITERIGRYYVSNNTADVTKALEGAGIEIQKSNDKAVVTNDVKEETINNALSGIDCNIIRVEDC